MWYFNEQTLVLEKIASSERAYFSVSKQVGDSDWPYNIRYYGDVEPGEELESFKSKEEAAKQLKNIARNLKAINLEPEQIVIPYYTPNYAPIISYLAEQDKYYGKVTCGEGETIVAGETIIAGETYECDKCIKIGTPQPTEKATDTTANKNSEYVITSIHYDTCDDIYYPL